MSKADGTHSTAFLLSQKLVITMQYLTGFHY